MSLNELAEQILSISRDHSIAILIGFLVIFVVASAYNNKKLILLCREISRDTLSEISKGDSLMLIGMFVFLIGLMIAWYLSYLRGILFTFWSDLIAVSIIFYLWKKIHYVYAQTENIRLNSWIKVVDYYKEVLCIASTQSPHLPNSETLLSLPKGELIPATTLFPRKNTEKYIPLDRIKFNFDGRLYRLPDELDSFLKPALTRLIDQFNLEGHFNYPKIRLNDICILPEGIKLICGKTFYFYSFITNFSADFRLFNKEDVTLRKIFIDETIRTSLKDSPFSNHLGFNALIITKDGYIPIPIRTRKVAVTSSKYASSLAGSFDWVPYLKLRLYRNPLEFMVLTELKEEIFGESIDVKKFVNGIYVIGIARNYVWLGKPDLYLLIFLNITKSELESFFKRNKKQSEHLDLFSKEIAIGSEIHDIQDLFNNSIQKTLLKKLDSLLGKEEALSLPLLINLLFLRSLLGSKNISYF